MRCRSIGDGSRLQATPRRDPPGDSYEQASPARRPVISSSGSGGNELTQVTAYPWWHRSVAREPAIGATPAPRRPAGFGDTKTGEIPDDFRRPKTRPWGQSGPPGGTSGLESAVNARTAALALPWRPLIANQSQQRQKGWPTGSRYTLKLSPSASPGWKACLVAPSSSTRGSASSTSSTVTSMWNCWGG